MYILYVVSHRTAHGLFSGLQLLEIGNDTLETKSQGLFPRT
jgi:hypothetical protein